MKPTSNKNRKIDIKKFKKGKKISKGGFGIVYKAEEIKTKKIYAAKIINCGDDESECNELIDREVSTMMHIEHPTIIKFIGYSPVDFNEDNNVVIFMELAANGSLSQVIQSIMSSNGPLDYTNTSRQKILVGVARGMKYLHDRNIIHRDLKPGNILLNSEFEPLITDFGMAKYFEVGHSYSQSQFGGTKPYQAPEILRGEKYDVKVDVYAFGILMFEVLTDSFAYPELYDGKLTDLNFQNKVANEEYRPVFKFPVKETLQELTELCWSNNPEDRPTFKDILQELQNLRQMVLIFV